MFETIINAFAETKGDIFAYFGQFRFSDGLDILLVTILIYLLIRLLRRSNAMSVLRGLAVLFAMLAFAKIFKLHVLGFLLDSALQVGVLALIVLFQPEFRKALGQMGSGNHLFHPEKGNLTRVVEQTVAAVRDMSKSRCGALMVFERTVRLEDTVKTGTILDAAVTAELIKNIFYPKAPLHDGAVVVKGGRIVGAGCILPLTANNNLSRDLGTRHRAGIGITENADAFVVIVSEETGSISVATSGMLKRHLTPETLERLMKIELTADDEEQTKGFWGRIRETARKTRGETP